MPSASEAACFDVLVLGGGPAGTAFAIGAARAGMRVLLLERHGYAEARTGEHIAGAARGRLVALGLPDDAGLCRFSPGILSFWSSGAPAFRSHGGAEGSRGFNTDRAQLDAALYAQAARCGVTTAIGETRALRRHDGAWHATLARVGAPPAALRADVVVDATGRRGAFLGQQGVEREAVGDVFALVTWLGVSQGAAGHGAPLAIGAGPHGWWSLVEAGGDVLSLAVYVSRSAMRAAGLRIDQALHVMLAEQPHLAERLRRIGVRPLGAAIHPAFPTRARRALGAGWLAIGDAAAAFDPVSGQGVAKALETAERAVELVLADPGLDRLGPLYAEAIEDRFHDHLLRRRDAYAAAGDRLGAAFLAGVMGQGALAAA